MKSSDWWAKENECRDSEGNRLRSSVKFSVGEEGPELMAKEGVRGFGSASVIEAVRGPTDGLREEDPEEGNVGARGGGCCRIRRRPEAPSPCSCSVMTGDLDMVSYSAVVRPASEKRIRAFSKLFGAFANRFPVLRFFGMARSGAGGDWLRPPSLSVGFVSTPCWISPSGASIIGRGRDVHEGQCGRG